VLREAIRRCGRLIGLSGWAKFGVILMTETRAMQLWESDALRMLLFSDLVFDFCLIVLLLDVGNVKIKTYCLAGRNFVFSQEPMVGEGAKRWLQAAKSIQFNWLRCF
jgi:hypothetical protein